MTMPMRPPGGETVQDYVRRVYGDRPARGHVAIAAATVNEAFEQETIMAAMGVCKPVDEQDPRKRVEAIISMVGEAAFLPQDLQTLEQIRDALPLTEPGA